MAVVRRCVLVALLAALAYVPVTAGHGTAAPPLTGEFLTARSTPTFEQGTIEVTADCNPSGRSTISYTATGPALAGPYPGTYVESGTATFGKLPTVPSTGAPLESFEARFTIYSSAGLVKGKKLLDPTEPSLGFCEPGGVAALGGPTFVPVSATYTAKITTATGTCTTEGETILDVVDTTLDQPETGFKLFDEVFRSGTPCV
jgi:hypothetical protein